MVVQGNGKDVKKFIKENFRTNKYNHSEEKVIYLYELDFEQFDPTPIDEKTGEKTGEKIVEKVEKKYTEPLKRKKWLKIFTVQMEKANAEQTIALTICSQLNLQNIHTQFRHICWVHY